MFKDSGWYFRGLAGFLVALASGLGILIYGLVHYVGEEAAGAMGPWSAIWEIPLWCFAVSVLILTVGALVFARCWNRQDEVDAERENRRALGAE